MWLGPTPARYFNTCTSYLFIDSATAHFALLPVLRSRLAAPYTGAAPSLTLRKSWILDPVREYPTSHESEADRIASHRTASAASPQELPSLAHTQCVSSRSGKRKMSLCPTASSGIVHPNGVPRDASHAQNTFANRGHTPSTQHPSTDPRAMSPCLRRSLLPYQRPNRSRSLCSHPHLRLPCRRLAMSHPRTMAHTTSKSVLALA